MRAALCVLALALACPAAAQPAPSRKPAVRQRVHTKPTPQQIRKFDELEQKEEKGPEDRGRSPSSGESPPKRAAAPSRK